MKAFKVALCIALTTFITLCPAVLGISAHADSRSELSYAYADVDSEVYFCESKKSDTAQFIIPETYCVKIIRNEDDWYYVRYAEDDGIYRAKYGYCKKDGLVLCKEPLENPYLKLTVTVAYSTPQVGNLPTFEKDLDAAFYGPFKDGQTDCSYVFCEESFFYVPETYNYPLNDLPSKSAFSPTSGNKTAVTLITASAVTAVAAAAILILYFSNKKPKITP